MPKNLFQSIVFTAIMVTAMVYGMVVYNIILATGMFSPAVFVMALGELPIMVPIAFVLEALVVGKLAKMIAFRIVDPATHPECLGLAIPVCICMIMAPTMSLVATLLFKEPSFMAWLKAWAMNLPVALAYQLLLCGPVVRRVFGLLFPETRAVRG